MAQHVHVLHLHLLYVEPRHKFRSLEGKYETGHCILSLLLLEFSFTKDNISKNILISTNNIFIVVRESALIIFRI